MESGTVYRFLDKWEKLILICLAVLIVGIAYAHAQTPAVTYTIPVLWTAPAPGSGITEIRIYEFTSTGRVLLGTVAPTATRYDVVGRSPGQYSFAAIGFNGFWESPDFDIISTPAPPPKIQGSRFGEILAAI